MDYLNSIINDNELDEMSIQRISRLKNREIENSGFYKTVDFRCLVLYILFIYKLAFPADIGRKLASLARGSRPRLHAG